MKIGATVKASGVLILAVYSTAIWFQSCTVGLMLSLQ